MQLIQTISMDFAVHGVAPRVFGKQDDSLSRLVRISLSSNGVVWAIPSDAIFMLRYRTPSGGVGLYDTLPDGSSAFSVAGNQITVVLVDQIFAAPGVAECDLRIISSGAGASTWTFLVEVDRAPAGDTIVSSDYFNVLTALAAQVAADADRAEAAAGNIDTSNLIAKTEKGAANGVASLDSAGKVPGNQLPSMDYIPASEKGAANGVASLDYAGRISHNSLPAVRSDTIYGTGSNGENVTVRMIRFGLIVILIIFASDLKSNYQGSISFAPGDIPSPFGFGGGAYSAPLFSGANGTDYAGNVKFSASGGATAIMTSRNSVTVGDEGITGTLVYVSTSSA